MKSSTCWELLCIFIILALLEFTASAPPGSSAKRYSRRRSSVRQGKLTDPTEVLEIPVVSNQDAELILLGLGYNEVDSDDGLLIVSRYTDSEEQSLNTLIRNFQRDNDLEETGELNDETKLAIGTPHCGFKKSAAKLADSSVQKWSKNALTYRIHNFPKGKRSAIIRATLTRAFMEWSKVTNLDFLEVEDRDADIEIAFGGRHHKQRGDRCIFEDPQTLAHAFFPEVGDIHFNSNYFFDDGMSLEDFMDTALHEIGHALGLEHTRSKASLMHPTESNQFTEPQPMDIENIQALYGQRRGGRSVNHAGPELCSLKKIDAGIDDDEGNRFVFAGDYYYDVDESEPAGRLISTKWPGLPGNIDAAVRYSDGKSYFFKGDKYWRFKGNRLEAGHPRLIRKGFPGLPNDIDALLVDGDGDIFAFKGNQYWVYDVKRRQVDRNSPGSVRDLRVPSKLDAALDTDTGILVFKGASVYEMLPDETWSKTDNEWLQC